MQVDEELDDMSVEEIAEGEWGCKLGFLEYFGCWVYC
jgi:hypothetical protein